MDRYGDIEESSAISDFCLQMRWHLSDILEQNFFSQSKKSVLQEWYRWSA